MEYASNSKGNLGVALGAIGTGLGAIGNLGWFGGNTHGCGGGWQNDFATRYDLNITQAMANKDAEIAMLRAESEAERKMIEVYKQTRSEIKALENDVTRNNYEIANMRRILNTITAVRVPNNAVCPGWGEVTVTPVEPEA